MAKGEGKGLTRSSTTMNKTFGLVDVCSAVTARAAAATVISSSVVVDLDRAMLPAVLAPMTTATLVSHQFL